MTEDYVYDGWGLCPEAFIEIDRILNTGDSILELGSGAGTGVLARKYKMISVEDDPDFIGKYDSKYLEVGLVPYTEEKFPFMWDFFKDDSHWYDPVELEKKLKTVGKYDLLLIDGPKGYRGGLLSNLHLFDLHKTKILIDDTHDNFHHKLAEVISEKTGRAMIKHESSYLTPDGVSKKFIII